VWSDEVSDTLTVNGKPAAHIDSVSPDPALDTDTVSFEGHGTDDGTIERYVWRSSLDSELHNGTASDFDTDELTLGQHTIYFRVRDEHGVWSDEEVFSGLLVESDGDGIGDYWDAFPTDPAASIDTDDDGYPDEWNAGKTKADSTTGLELDAFPTYRYEWKDTDSDYKGDNSDAFPVDPAASIDTDGDGYPDEWNPWKTKADSTTGLELDAFPDDPDEWKDSDGDGVGDNSDVLPTVGMIQTYPQVVLVLIILACIVSAPSARKRQLRRSASKHLARLDGKQRSLASKGIIMDSSLHADAVSEFQHGHYRKARNYAKTGFYRAAKTEKEFKTLRKDMESMKQNVSAAANSFDVSEIREKALDPAVAALEQRYLEAARKHLNRCRKLLNDAEKNARPILSVTIPDSIPSAGRWHRVRARIRNDGSAHAQNIAVQFKGGGQIKFTPVQEIRSGEEVETELGIMVNESGTVPVVFDITAARPQDNRPFTSTSELWLNVGSASAAPGAAPAFQSTNIQILRETENFRGFVRTKIGILNETGATITDCRLRLLIDTNVLRFDHIEPAYITRGEEIELGNINFKEKKTVAVYLDPMMCTTTAIDAVLTYRDSRGNIQTEKMRKKDVNVICPIFFTRETANTAMLKNLVANVLRQQDSKIFNIPRGLSPQEAFEIAKSAVSGRSVNFVREFSSSTPFAAEAWYYGVTKVKKMQMVIKVSVLEETNSIEIFAAAHSEEALTGLLAELGHDLSAKLKKKGMPAVQVTNVTIKDSIVHKSSLLFNETAGEGMSNVRIEDSVLQKTTIGGDAMKVCPNCSNMVEADQNFCTRCGTAL